MYIPEHYTPTFRGDMVFWGSEGSQAIAASIVPVARDRITTLLEWSPRRALHVVVYATNADARGALKRNIGAAALLSPLHTPERAMIALQSPRVHPRNGDLHRMRRHISHELAHVFSAEQTGSVKRLGDGNRGMRIVPWVDEGFAECVAAVTADQPDVLERARARAARHGLSEADLTAAFSTLNAPDRSIAYAVATVRVWRRILEWGWGPVFENLSTLHKRTPARPD